MEQIAWLYYSVKPGPVILVKILLLRDIMGSNLQQ